MKNLLTMAALALAATLFVLAGCEENTTPRDVSENVEDAAEKAGEKIEEAAEETGEAVEEAAEEVKDAVDG